MRRLPLLPLVFASAVRCASPASRPTTPASNDASFLRLHDSYVVEFLRRNPSVNTYLGGAGLDPALRETDGRLRDHSQRAIDAEDHWLSEMQRTMSAVNPDTLSPRRRIDRDVALAQIRYQLHLHQVRRYQQRCIDTYVDEPYRAIDFQMQGMTQTGAATFGTPDEWSLVARRLEGIPAFLANAETQLRAGIATHNTADFRMLYRHGIVTAESDAKYFDATMTKLAFERIVAGPQRDALVARIRQASKMAAVAYRHFRDVVATTFFDDASRENGVKKQFGGDRFAFGEAEYDWALKNNLHVGKTAARLYDESWPIVLETQRRLATLAREIGGKHGWSLPAGDNAAARYVFDQLAKDYPKSDTQMVEWYRDAAFRLVDYARRTGLFDVPADYKLDIVETPPPLRTSIDGAAYYPAPPFKITGVGRFYVTPTDNDPAVLKQHNRSALADLAAHEGLPGHDWYYKVMTTYRDEISAARWLTPGAVEDSSSMWQDSMSAEGWALYAEALIAEPPGFYTPEERLYQLQGKLYRDLRVRIDIGIHTGRLEYDVAVDMFSSMVDFEAGSCRDAIPTDGKRASCANAERAIFRYSKAPTQAITYRLGRDEIYSLREEAAKQLGVDFDLKRFHLMFMRQGSIPAGYFREELLRVLRGK